MNAQRERPILFSGLMVRAILDGRKTQTRRVVKHESQPETGAIWRECVCREIDPSDTPCVVCEARFGECHHGHAGDRLWVKETHARIHPGLLQHLEPEPDSPQWGTLFRADGVSDNYIADYGVKWKPSIFMRREYSRITLEITGVRVERLQEISYDDALAEGVFADKPAFIDAPMSAIDAYATLWNQINGCDAWEQNPLVWVIKFKQV